jgi:hypothetical protein
MVDEVVKMVVCRDKGIGYMDLEERYVIYN